MSAAEGHSFAECTVLRHLCPCALQTVLMGFFFSLTASVSTQILTLQCCHGAFEVGTGKESPSTTVEDHYHQAYFEVLDLAIASISDRFHQPGYAIYENLESLIVSAANCEPFDQHLIKKVVEFYENDLNSSILSAQLQNLGSWFTGKGEQLLLKDYIKAMQEISTAQKEFFSEVHTVARLILIMPATNAVTV